MQVGLRRIVYFQPRLNAGRNYRNAGAMEQVWTPWWALLLHQHAGRFCEACLVDARLDAAWEATLASELSAGAVLAVSVMTGHSIRDAIRASDVARQAGARVVWGGPHATLLPHSVLSEPFVDHVVAGFGADGFGTLVAHLVGGSEPPRLVEGRGRQGPAPVTSLNQPPQEVPFRPSLDLVPDWEPYVNSDQALGTRVVNMVTSEGCLRRCTYCSEPATSRFSWLTYSIEDCVESARVLLDHARANSLKLHDPNFMHDLERGLRFGELLSSVGHYTWAATIHPADLLALADSQIATLASSGLRRVLVGLESPVQHLVNLAGKSYDVTRIPDIATKLGRHGIAGMFTFIVGWPRADQSHYQATIECAFAIREIYPAHQAKIHFLEPWPGTPLAILVQRLHPGALPRSLAEWADIDYYFAHLPSLHAKEWEGPIRRANSELSPYVEA